MEVSVTENPYELRGAVASELRDEMNRGGPLDRDGVRHDAYTGWSVTWTYPYARSSAGCATGPVRVTVFVTYTLPHWTPPARARDPLRRRWLRYVENLRVHEDVHRDIGVNAAEEIRRRMEALAPRPTCGALELAADAVSARLLGKYRNVERTYDRDTHHGASQGASFP